MEGENPQTTAFSEIQRWIRLYSELVEFEEATLRRMRGSMGWLSYAARKEAERTNLPALMDDCRRFRARLTYWRQRLRDLALQDDRPADGTHHYAQ
jgi:hypothetical protein